MHWRNPDIHVVTDMDLTAIQLNAEWGYVEQIITYTNQRSSSVDGLCPSGDVRNAPEGASENIDIPLDVLRASGVRYVVFNVYSFERTLFCQVPECFFG